MNNMLSNTFTILNHPLQVVLSHSSHRHIQDLSRPHSTREDIQNKQKSIKAKAKKNTLKKITFNITEKWSLLRSRLS